MGLIHDLPTVISATAAPGQVSFTFPFKAFSIQDIDVTVDDVVAIYNAAPVDAGHYKILFNVDEGGQIVFGAPMVGGEVILIVSDIPIERVTQFPNTGPVPMSDVNLELNRHIRIMQDLDDGLSRTIQVPAGEDGPLVLPPEDERVSGIIGFDQNGDIVILPAEELGSIAVVAQRIEYIATAGQTIFATPFVYQVGYVSVFVNGVKLSETEFVATNGTQVELNEPCFVGDIVALEAFLGAAGPGDAAMSSFQQAGAGAVLRNAQDKMRETVSLPDFGALSGGAFDCTAAFNAAMTQLTVRGGGTLLIPPGVWRFVLNIGVPNRGLAVAENVTVMAYGATCNLECVGEAIYGVRLRNNAKWCGGKVRVTVSVTPGDQGIWHAPFGLGAAYDDGGVVGNLSPFTSVSGWEIRDVELYSARVPYWAGISGISDVRDGRISNVTILDSATCFLAVGFDWGTVGYINKNDITGSRAAFDAGTAYTTHPHNIQVDGVFCGVMTAPEFYAFRLSACHSVTGNNINVKQITGTLSALFKHTAGDLGYEFAPVADKPFRHRGISVSNSRCYDCGTSVGAVYIDAYADNIADAVALGYSALVGAVSRLDMVLSNLFLRTNAAAPPVNTCGIRAEWLFGLRIENCDLHGFYRGYNGERLSHEVTIEGGTISSTVEHGIYVHGPSVPTNARPTYFTARNVTIYGAGRNGATAALIYMDGTDNPMISGCRLGIAGETASYAIRLNDGCVGAHVRENHTVEVKAGGAVYSLGSGESYTLLRSFLDNTSSSVLAAAQVSGVTIRTLHTDQSGRKFCEAPRAALPGDTTPPGGTWVEGSRLRLIGVNPSGFSESVCTASGTPGTWKGCNIASA